MLLHLHNFVTNLGDLNKYSTFPFENFLSGRKRDVKKVPHLMPHGVQQIIRKRNLMELCRIETKLFFTDNPPTIAAL